MKNWTWKDTIFTLLTLLVLGIVTGLGTLLVLTARADGKPDYCYFDTASRIPGVVGMEVIFMALGVMAACALVLGIGVIRAERELTRLDKCLAELRRTERK